MSNIIAITQPYVPAYRVPLFEELARQAEPYGFQVVVYSSKPTGEQQARGDLAGGGWNRPISTARVGLGRYSVQVRPLSAEARRAAVLITELEASNLTAWVDTVRSRPTVLWGHGKGYVNETERVSDLLESVLAARCSHTMTYAESGRDFLLRSGRISPDRVTAIGNSTDSRPLRAATLSALAATTDVAQGPSALYVGGLDAPKRIDFLLAAFEQAARIDPAFTLTVVGKGTEQKAVQAKAAHTTGLTYLPEARGADLARLGAAASAMWVPGRVGLVAVDALAMGLPVHTTPQAQHAPEIEFLREDELAFFGPTPGDFAAGSLRAMWGWRRSMRDDIPTIEAVADAMIRVVLSVLGE